MKRSQVLIAVTSAGALPAVARAQPAGTVTLRVAAGLTEPTTPILYAQSSGLFAKAGLNVEMQRPQSGAVTAAAVIGGALEFGKSSPLELFSAHLRNVPLVWVSPASLYRAEAPDGGLLVAKDSPLRTARDLTGKVIAVTALNDLNTIGVRAWTDKNGGDSSTLKLVELSPGTMPAALEAGRIDAPALFNPVFEAALTSGKTRLVAHIYDSIAKRFLSAAWFTSQSYADNHREILDRFEHVMVEANAYTNGHFAETLPLIAQYSGLDPTAIAHMTRSVAALYLDARDIQPLIDSAAKYKVISRSFPAEELFSSTALKPPRSARASVPVIRPARHLMNLSIFGVTPFFRISSSHIGWIRGS
jgi:NitT/TauT family transport system substrate-binding protein